jgi:hypothetical protein
VRHIGAVWRKTSARAAAIEAVCEIVSEAVTRTMGKAA